MPTAPAGRLRLLFLAGIAATMFGLIGWAAWASWRDFQELEEGVEEADRGSFRIAEGFHASIHELSHTLLRFGARELSEELERFRTQSRRLNEWMEVQKGLTTTAREREALEEIDRAYDAYLAAAEEVTRVAERTDDHRQILRALDEAAYFSSKLLDLGHALDRAGHEARVQWRDELRESLFDLQLVIFGSLFCLLGVATGASALVYRQLIRPLRRQLDESRELLERQERLASLGVLAAGVAHEIRNPLTAIKVRLFTLREELAMTQIGQEETQVIANEIRRLERILNDFLNFARPSEPQLEYVSPSELLRELRDFLAPELEARSITITLDLRADTPVRADPEQLKQVLINLVRNAADAIGTSGATTLSTRRGMGVIGDQRAPCVFIEVRDTGSGIDPEVQRRLFDPFFSTKEKGSGLGLSIAARIVERHGGTLTYRTRSKEGTTFTIALPQPG